MRRVPLLPPIHLPSIPTTAIGYAQIWNLNVQRDLPFALQIVATYVGIKGTHGAQQFLPNTDPHRRRQIRAPACPIRICLSRLGRKLHAQARRRSNCAAACATALPLRSITPVRNRSTTMPCSAARGTDSARRQMPRTCSRPDRGHRAELAQSARRTRALHLRSAPPAQFHAQYTSGEGLGGGTLMSGWRGRLLKEWTLLG